MDTNHPQIRSTELQSEVRDFIVLVALFPLILGGCGQRIVPIPSSPAPTHTGSDASAGAILSTPALTSFTPQPGTAVVVGTAVWQGADDQAATGIDLYLADVSQLVEGGASIAKLDPGSAPKAVVYETGAFIFTDIPPGRYALAASISPANSTLISDPETSRELVISVEAGDIVDLGTVYVPSLW